MGKKAALALSAAVNSLPPLAHGVSVSAEFLAQNSATIRSAVTGTRQALAYSASLTQLFTEFEAKLGQIGAVKMAGKFIPPIATLRDKLDEIAALAAKGNAASKQGLEASRGAISALDKMDEMVSVLKSQLGVSEKLLKYQS
jgi:hypothetical protein